MRTTATAVMNISMRPPRRRASTVTPTIAAVFASPIVNAREPQLAHPSRNREQPEPANGPRL